MHGLFKTLQGHACSEFDRLALAHRFSEIFLTDPRPERAAPNMYLLLAGFENSLQRYQSAYDYTTIFLQLSSGSARGMLMRLHFAYALEKFDEIATLKGTLEKLDSAGKLNATQSKTLSFYN